MRVELGLGFWQDGQADSAGYHQCDDMVGAGFEHDLWVNPACSKQGSMTWRKVEPANIREKGSGGRASGPSPVVSIGSGLVKAGQGMTGGDP